MFTVTVISGMDLLYNHWVSIFGKIPVEIFHGISRDISLEWPTYCLHKNA